jgi:hypothetical protein
MPDWFPKATADENPVGPMLRDRTGLSLGNIAER